MNVRFNDLPLPARERFLAMALAAPNDPRLLFFRPTTNIGGLANWLIGGLAFIPIVTAFDYVFDRGARVDPSHSLPAYLALAGFVAVVVAAVAGIAFRFLWGG